MEGHELDRVAYCARVESATAYVLTHLVTNEVHCGEKSKGADALLAAMEQVRSVIADSYPEVVELWGIEEEI